jgi:hypothetical protein
MTREFVLLAPSLTVGFLPFLSTLPDGRVSALGGLRRVANDEIECSGSNLAKAAVAV